MNEPVQATHATARQPWLRAGERLLLVIATVGLGYFAWGTLESTLYQAYENRQLEAILASAPAAPSRPTTHRVLPAGTTIGRI